MYVTIPEPEPVVDLETGAPILKPDGTPELPVTFQKLMAKLIYCNPYLGDDGEDIGERIWRLRHASFGARPGDAIEVSGDDVKAVCAIIAKPNGDGKRSTGRCNACGARPEVRWTPEGAVYCVPFFRAWKNATHTKPEPAKEPTT